ncbi:MAG: aspartate carbamoyltransferase [Candidatus Moranbacteria bacterium]|nr:aspartate carbamoyltransferase [Candidatus Moranbacteria bacterium]
MRHVIESQQFERKSIDGLFAVADALEKKKDASMKGKIMASLFYEPSTRTRFSFESAMLRLGGNVITTENAKEFSSVSKGETLEDSIRVVNGYVDVIVLRHDEEGSSKRASLVSDVPVINAGDGSGQHPTQALLDLYTIRRELGKIDGLRIAFVGDLKHGRTIRSLSYLLGKYRNITIWFVSPKGLRVGEDIKEYLGRHGVSYSETEDLDAVVPEVDVVYQTRIQKERFKNAKEYSRFKGCYKIDMAVVKRMKRKSIIMHPLPRVDEIATEVDASPKAVYFKQARYGLLIRMALLKLVVGKK